MNGRVLLEGISDFWLRYFEDADLLVQGHTAALEAAGRSYQNMLMSLMRLSLKDTPLLESCPWQNMVVYEDSLLPVGPAGFLWRLPYDIREVDLLHNVVFSPTRVLERGFDFEVVADDRERLAELRFYNPSVPKTGWYLLFGKDLFDWTDAGDACPGFAMASKVFELPVRIKSVQVPDWTATDVAAGHIVKALTPDGITFYATVATVTATHLDCTPRTPLPSDAAYLDCTVGTAGFHYDDIVFEPLRCTVSSVATRVRVLSAWAPDAKKDYYSLYEMYGLALSSAKEPSTEEYRAFIRGVWNLYIGGPAFSRIESALNVVCGYPVIRENDEEIVEIALPTDIDVVITTEVDGVATPQAYLLPNGTPLRADLVAAARTYGGVERDDALTLFTDLTVLETISSFKDIDITLGTTVLRVGGMNYLLTFVFDSHVQVAAQGPWDGETEYSWSIKTNATVLASGSAGVFLPNTAVPKKFKAFDSLTTVFAVTDYVETPDWWENSTIPVTLVPGLPPNRRDVTPATHRNLLNEGGDLARVGDLGLIVGQDDTGEVPTEAGLQYLYDVTLQVGFKTAGVVPGDSVVVYDPDDLDSFVTRVVASCGEFWLSIETDTAFDLDVYTGTQTNIPYKITGKLDTVRDTATLDYPPGSHHLVSWLLMDKLFKWNMFSVTFDVEHAVFPRSQAFVLDLIMQAKPAHTFPYVSGTSSLRDNYTVFNSELEDLALKVICPITEQITGLENSLYVGAREYCDFEDVSSGEDWVDLGMVAGDFIDLAGLVLGVLDVSSFPTASYYLTGTLSLINGSNTVIGVGTRFLDELPIGQRITIGGDDYYVVKPSDGFVMDQTTFYLDRNWELPTQAGIEGLVPAGFSNRARVEVSSGYPAYAEGLTYSIRHSVGVAYFTSEWPCGSLLGGIGTYRNAFIGGMDPLIDRHELEATRVGLPSSVSDLAVLRHLVNGISVANEISGYTIVAGGDGMVVSDIPCSVRVINAL